MNDVRMEFEDLGLKALYPMRADGSRPREDQQVVTGRSWLTRFVAS